jgi:predicted RNA-binding Zn-ribbon protein involved in translation (DUF1610 family)
MKESCGAKCPDRDGIICTDPPHPAYGYHFDANARHPWKGEEDIPLKTPSKKDKKKGIRDAVLPEIKTGPPTAVGVMARPYTQDGAPSAGYASGSETSKDSEEARAGSQRQVYELVVAAGAHGITGHEANDAIGKSRLTTGQAALSDMHKVGLIARLAEVRDKQQVYVLPEHINGRETRAHRSRSASGLSECPNCGHDLTQ